MNHGTLSLHGIMNPSILALAQIDRSVRKYLSVSDQGVDLGWNIISDLIHLYGSSAERQFLHSLISFVVSISSSNDQPDSFDINKTTTTTTASSASLSILSRARKLVVDHYPLDFTKPVLTTALNSAFKSFKKSSSSLTSSEIPSPTDFLTHLGKALNLSIYSECLCSVSLLSSISSSSKSESNHLNNAASSSPDKTTTVSTSSSSSSSDYYQLHKFTCSKINELIESFFDLNNSNNHNNNNNNNNNTSNVRADVLKPDSVAQTKLLCVLIFISKHPHEFQSETKEKFFKELRTFYNKNNPQYTLLFPHLYYNNNNNSRSIEESEEQDFLNNHTSIQEQEEEEEEESRIVRKSIMDSELNPGGVSNQVISYDPGAVDFVLEHGPAICNTIEECRTTLSTVGPQKITSSAVAHMIHGFIKAQDALNQQQQNQSQNIWGDTSPLSSIGKDNASNDKFHSATNSSSSSSSNSAQTSWNGKIFVQVVSELVPNLIWKEVFHELDFPGFFVKNGRPFRTLMETLRYSLHLQGQTRPEQFPIEAFYRRWNNTEGQLSLLKCCLSTANLDIFSFADFPFHATQIDILKTTGDKAYESKEIQQWKSIELLEMLMYLSDAGHYAAVHDLFQFPLTHCPDILLLGLIQLSSPMNIIRHELMASLFPVFLNNHVNSGVILQHSWHYSASNSIQPIMIHAMAEWYLRGDYDQTKLSRILDVAQDLKALPRLLNASSHVFIIDLACLASRREFLKLDKWLTDKMREHGEVFILSMIKVLNRRVPLFSGKHMDEIPKTAQLPQETINTMIQCLHQCVGKVNHELSDSVLSLVSNYNIMFSKPRTGGPPIGPQQPPQPGMRAHRTPLEAAFAASVNPSTGPSPGIFPNSNNVNDQLSMSALGSTLANLNLASGGGGSNFGNPLGPTPGSPSRLLGPNFGPNSISNNALPPTAANAYPMLSGLQMGPGGGPNPNPGPGQGGTGPSAALSGLSGNPMSSMLSGRISGQNLVQNVGGTTGGTAGDKRATTAAGVPDSALLFNEIQPGDISKEAEDEANSYFHRIYSKPPDPTMSIDEVLDLLKRFQDSSIRREREVFTCMLRNLFEEYKFFPQYPEKELHTTAQLFGGIIEQGLVSTFLQLGVALRFVVDALKKPPGSKMYYFGIAALDRFKTRLKEYPQYCQHLMTIPHYQQFPEQLVEYIDCGSKSQEPPSAAGNRATGTGGRTGPTTPSLPGSTSQNPPNNSSSSSGQPNSTNNIHNTTSSNQNNSHANSVSNPIQPTPQSAATPGQGRPSIANATNINTLLIATEKEEKITTPPEGVQDKTAFIFNNLNQMNLPQKCDELKEIIGNDHWHWVAQYLVMKRASIELNFHTLYSNLLDTLRVKDLNYNVLRETHRNIKILLKTDKSAGNFADRQLLKNLGHWLGMITLMRNIPIILDDLDIKSLIIEAYRKGLQDLLYVVPFAAKIMESCARSIVFKPPCPWTMAILNVLAELHREPDMKLNLKFEIEVLCKALTVEVSDLKPKGILKDDKDFKIHVQQLSYPNQQQQVQPAIESRPVQQIQNRTESTLPALSKSSQAQSGGSEAITTTLQSQSQSPTPQPQQQQQVVPATTAAPTEDTSSTTISSPTLMGSGVALGQQQQSAGGLPGLSTTPTLPMSTHEPKFSYMEVDTGNLGGLLSHITVNSQLPLLQAHPNLRTIIRPAIEKAIQDLLGPVVERSIKYTINACERIVKKDFALDPEETRMRMGAHHMMRYLTAGMAMITSRDHIFVAISNNLKQGFQAAIRLPNVSQQMKDLVEQASQVVAQDNMELACVFIQKTAVEKALVEVDKRLAPEYDQRKNAKLEGRRHCDTVMLAYQSERIPEPIRVKQQTAAGLLSQQLAVYEDFSRNIPGFIPPSDGEVPFLAPKFPPNVAAPTTAAAAAATAAVLPGSGSNVVGPAAVGGAPGVAPLASGAGDELPLIYEKLIGEIEIYYQALVLSHSPAAQQLSAGVRALVEAIRVARNTSSVVAGISLLQKAVEGLLEGLATFPTDPEIIRFRDAHLMVLKALQDPRAFGKQWVNRQVTKCLIEIRPELKYNIEAVDTLIRANLVNMIQFDAHLATAMEKGSNILATTFAMQLVQMYLVDDRFATTVTAGDLYHTVDMLVRCSQVNPRQHPEGLPHLIEILRSTASHEPDFVDRAPGGATTHIHSGITQSREFDDPQGLSEKSEILLREWVRLYLTQGTPKDSSKAFASFIHELNSSGILKSDDVITRFFRICVQCCVNQVYQGLQAGPLSLVRSKCYQSIDALVRLVALLIRHIGDSPTPKVNLLNKFLGIVAGLLIQEHELQKTDFQQLPFHRLFMMLFYDLNTEDPVFQQISMQVLTGFSNTMHILNPIKVPGFAYAWLEIIGNRLFIARMLALAADQKCWAMYCQLILDLFRFLFPFLRNAELAKPVSTLYRGTLRVLLVVLHDFPDFLCDYCHHFLDAIPPNCIQMRNLVLSAFPRNMRLPDPFTANLKFEMLADTAMAPRILSNFGNMIQPATFKKDLDSYLKTRAPVTFLSELRTNLQANEPGTRYNIPLMNALVLYVGSQHIASIRARNQTPNMSTVAHTSHMDIFQNLAVDLDTEGRYLFLNALANQLRFPSSHTHYFSLVILYLFAQSNTEDVQEQITRVLLERLVVNRPHPWGLLVTFIELIKNPTYKFWQHEFVHCAPEVEKLFESVARSCMVTKSSTPLSLTSGAAQSGLNLVNSTGASIESNGGNLLNLDNNLDQL